MDLFPKEFFSSVNGSLLHSHTQIKHVGMTYNQEKEVQESDVTFNLNLIGGVASIARRTVSTVHGFVMVLREVGESTLEL